MPTKSFLSELQSQFDRLRDTKERLDSKAINMMTISGTISTLLMGVGAFLLNAVDLAHSLSGILLFLFIFGISLMIGTIVISINAYKLRDQDYPIGSKIFFENDERKDAMINRFIDATEKTFEKRMIEEYLDCIKQAEEKIKNKGHYVKWSQICFLIGILTLPIIVIISIIIFGTIPTAE